MTLSLWNLWWSSGISLFFLSFFSSIFNKFLSSCQDILLSLTELGCWCGVALSAMIACRLQQMERSSFTFINGMFLLYFTIDAVMGALETFFSFRLFREKWWQYYLDILIFFNLTLFSIPIFTLSTYQISFFCLNAWFLSMNRSPWCWLQVSVVRQ